MTAVNIYLFNDRAIIWTDGASYDGDGRVRGFASKVEPLPHLNAVVAVRGLTIAAPLIAIHMGGRFDTFDEMAEGFADAVADIVRDAHHVFELRPYGTDYQAFLIGRSEARGTYEAYLARSDEPGTIQKRDAVTFAPNNGVAERILAEVPNLIEGPLATAEVGLRVMEMQRELRFKGMGGVGGFAQATVISVAGISTQIVHRWPDRIGEKIGEAA